MTETEKGKSPAKTHPRILERRAELFMRKLRHVVLNNYEEEESVVEGEVVSFRSNTHDT